jgi:hypothetical protein
VALVAILAMLFQAVLFAWHHHAAPFYWRPASAVTSLAAPTSPVMPASADHLCEICFTLSHHGFVPVDFFAAKPPEEAPLHQTRMAAVDTPLAPYFLFRSRAPPPP